MKPRLLPIVLILLVAALIWSLDLSRRWIGYYDSDGAYFHVFILNYDRYGLLETEGAQILDFAEKPKGEWQIYVHFPQLLPIVLYAGHELWGGDEFSLRVLMWFITILVAAMVFHIMRRLFNWYVGIWGLVFFCLSPMVMLLSRIPEYEPMAMLFMLVALGAYLYGLQHPDTWRWVWVAGVAMALAAWTGWAVYIFAAVLFLHALVFGARKHQVATFGLGILVGVMGLLFLLHLHLTTPDGVERLFERYSYRSSSIIDANSSASDANKIEEPFTMTDFFLRMFLRLLSGYTPTTVAFAGIALFLLIRKPAQWQHLPLGERLLPMVVVLSGFGYATAVRQATHLHEYLWYYMGIGLAMAAAPAVGLLWRRWKNPQLRLVAMGLLLFTSFFGAARLINDYRTFNVYPIRHGAGEDIRAFIEPDEAAATNLPSAMLLVPNFYARSKNLRYEITPEDFQSAEGINIYYYCELDDGTPMPEWSDAFMTHATQYEECTLVERETTLRSGG